MRRWIVQHKCKYGGYGWGETGDEVSIGGYEAYNVSDAYKQAANRMPRGWQIISIKEEQA